MGTAYTPGLTITAKTVVKKTRLLPLRGDVLVGVGDRVSPDTVVARAKLPGDVATIKINERLGVDAVELTDDMVHKKLGDTVERGEIIASRRALFGLMKSEAKSPVAGIVEYYSHVTGHMGIRREPRAVEVRAYIEGKIDEVLGADGCIIAAAGAFLQGIFGVGGERQGTIRVVTDGPRDEITLDCLPDSCDGMVLVGGTLVREPVLVEAAKRGAAAVIVGGVIDRDLAAFLGHDIGVAITGQEDVPLTLILTEGFGTIEMAHATFELLRSLDGRMASVNGATQIRAGALRPEIIVPDPALDIGDVEPFVAQSQLEVGTPVRVIRVPYFGELARVTELPAELKSIGTGARVRILQCEIQGGEHAGQVVTVPRANVEIVGLKAATT